MWGAVHRFPVDCFQGHLIRDKKAFFGGGLSRGPNLPGSTGGQGGLLDSPQCELGLSRDTDAFSVCWRTTLSKVGSRLAGVRGFTPAFSDLDQLKGWLWGDEVL